MKALHVKINGRTLVYGIIGYPVFHSFSPWMQTYFFRKKNINAVYCPFNVEPENLFRAVAGFKAINVQGLNVTVPHKEKILPHLDRVSREAKMIGAVNTVLRREGVLEGHNTDGYGFLKSLVTQAEKLPDGTSFLIFGLGGAARAIVYTLAREKAAKIIVSSRRKRRAGFFCREVNSFFGEEICQSTESYSDDFYQQLSTVDVVVNCSPLGMNPEDPLPFPPERCREKAVVYDLIYNPPLTPLLKKAEKNGLLPVNGLGMLIFQGMKSFKLWTEKDVTPFFESVHQELVKNIEVK